MLKDVREMEGQMVSLNVTGELRRKMDIILARCPPLVTSEAGGAARRSNKNQDLGGISESKKESALANLHTRVKSAAAKLLRTQSQVSAWFIISSYSRYLSEMCTSNSKVL